MGRPLFQRRLAPPKPWVNVAVVLISISAALVMGMALFYAKGVSPTFAFYGLFRGAFGRLSSLIAICVKATPLMLSGLAMVVAFKAKVWNLGGNGQIYLGALFATLVGLSVRGPAYLHVPLGLFAGFVGGFMWIALPAFLRACLKVNETIVTLMFNYVALFLISWLVQGPLQEVGGYMPQTPSIARTAWLPLLCPSTSLHVGIIIALLMAMVVHFLLSKTTFGYELRAVGTEPMAARYGGVNVEWRIFTVMCLSGGLMGLAGAIEIMGVHHRLLVGITADYGFTGMVVALLSGLHPLGTVFAAFFFSSLIIGGNAMQKITGVPISSVYVLEALIVLFVIGGQILTQYSFAPLSRLWEKSRLRRGSSKEVG